MNDDPVSYDLSPKEPPPGPICPRRHAILPGPLAGSLTFRDLACLKDKCAHFNREQGLCSQLAISGALVEITRLFDHYFPHFPTK